jgi:sugar phosphate isomerase/epimerase
MKIGIQVSSFRPVLTTEQEVALAFQRMKAMGCDTVQLQWIDPAVSIEFIGETLKNTGIVSVSVQDFYETIRENRDYYDTLNGATGGTWICVSRIPERLKTREGLDLYVAELRAMASELALLGQKLCFHPVSGDFAPIAGLDPVEYLLEAMPELMICADLYHLNKSGKDMCAWLRRYAGRVCMVHFKDSRTDENGKEELVPAGQGDTDWTGVVEACVETGVEYGFAEQERWQGDPFDRLKEAFDWLAGQLK